MTKPQKNIAVIGAGAWGTALAQAAIAAGCRARLYARDPGLAESILQHRENKTYLPGISLSPALETTADMAAAVRDADLVLLVAPLQHLRETLRKLQPHLPAGVPLLNAAKGIEISTGKRPSEIVAEMAPGHPYGILSGPTFADEVAKGLPSAITLATTDAAGRDWAQTIGSKVFRPYLSDDVTGVEIAGALKNVIAIACGVVEGKKMGQNARAAVMTRGMAEIRRFGMTRGARVETFLGLSGIGDLTLTCNSMSSRNFSTGVALGQGKKLAEIMAARRSVSEGVTTTEALAKIAARESIDMPIVLAVDAILHLDAEVDDVVRNLLSREVRTEGE